MRGHKFPTCGQMTVVRKVIRERGRGREREERERVRRRRSEYANGARVAAELFKHCTCRLHLDMLQASMCGIYIYMVLC